MSATTAGEKVIYLKALEELYYILKDDPDVFREFNLPIATLKRFGLEQLVTSGNIEESFLGSNFALLLFRYDQEIKLSDITTEAQVYEILVKREALEIWSHIGVKSISTNFAPRYPKE